MRSFGLNSIHELRLQQIVIMIQLKALVQQTGIYLPSESHQPHSLIFDLRHQSLVAFTLRSNQLCQEILTVRFSNRLRLVVEHIS